MHYHDNFSVQRLLCADDETLLIIFPDSSLESVKLDLRRRVDAGLTMVCASTCDNQDPITGACRGHQNPVISKDNFYGTLSDE